LGWQKLEDEERKLGFSLEDVAINDMRLLILCESEKMKGLVYVMLGVETRV
jgi:hypothetical protein